MVRHGVLSRIVAISSIVGIMLAELPAPAAASASGVSSALRAQRSARALTLSGPDAAWTGGQGGVNNDVARQALNNLTLGTPLKGAVTRLGTPWIVVRQFPRTYWMYRTDRGHAWLVLGVEGGRVYSVQVALYAHDASTLKNAMGVQLGGSGALVGSGSHSTARAAGDSVVTQSKGGTGHLFYGIDRSGRVDRLGRSLNSDDLAAYARWYEFDGSAPDRPIPTSATGGTTGGEEAYVTRLNDPYIPCLAGGWRISSRRSLAFAKVSLLALDLRCGNTPLMRPLFVAASSMLPRAFDVDQQAHSLLGQQTARTKAAPAGTTGQAWITTPNGTRMINNGVDNIDFTYAIINDPNNPISGVSVQQVALGETGLLKARGSGSASPLALNISCSVGVTGGKCTGSLDDGAPCLELNVSFGSYNVFSNVACYAVANDPLNLPNTPPSTGGTGCTGSPVNVSSGNLWYQYKDAKLSGPFGLEISHRYDSTQSGTTTGQLYSDLGIGWRQPYAAYLDVSHAASDGFVTYHDADCNRVYLQTLDLNTSSFDQYSGDTLYTQSNGTYKLVTWDNRTLVFSVFTNNPNFALLTSITDRIGNVQTINRSGATGDITTVVDSLGRALSFTYDSSNRIKTITSAPSGISLSFQYDSDSRGTCYTGDLCTVTESDNSVWTYEYYNPSSNNGYHLLQDVLDPLGHTEEYNKYQQINLGNGDNHFRVTEQWIGSQQNDNTYSYSTSLTNGTTTIADPVGNSTAYNWGQTLQEVTNVSGYLCFCRGDSLAYGFDTFGRPTSVSEGTTSTLVIAGQYGRDKLFTSPDGKTTYVAIAYRSITQLTQYAITTSNGSQNKVTQLSYYALGTAQQDLPQTVTEPSVDTPSASAVTTFTFTTAGLPTQISRLGYSNGTSTTHAVSATYDAKGRILTFTGPRTDVSQTTTFGYFPDSDSDLSRRGQLKSITDALSHQTTFATAAAPNNTYTVYGGALSTIDPNGVVTDLAYDQRGRLNQITLNGVPGDPTNLVTMLAYNAIGQLVTTTRPLGNAIANSYDTSNRPTALTIIDATAKQREQLALSYNNASQLLIESAQICGTPATTCSTWQTRMTQTFGYNSAVGTLATVNDGGGGQTAFAWDQYGNNTGVTAGDSTYQYTTTNGFDPSHFLTSTRLSGSTYASYTHDLQANLTRTNTPPTASSNQFFDDFGCLIKQVSTYTGTTTQTCDPAGNVTAKTDANGAAATTTYDALNRPLQQVSSRTGRPNETVTWTYDNATSGAFGIGRLASMTDPSGSTSYTYERRGLLASMMQHISVGVYATTYTYDGNGNRTTIQLPGSSNPLTYTFDYADRPLSVNSGSTTFVSHASYQPLGPRSQITFGNGTQETITYDQGYRETGETVAGTVQLSNLTYTVNSASYVTKITDNLNAGYTESLAYGGVATKMLAQVMTGSHLWGTASYSDTFSENLLTANFPGRNLTYGYSRTYALQSINQAGSGTTAITHDAVGNETGVGTASYTYSARELLSAGDGLTYAYDGFGRRVTAHLGPQTRNYLYDPDMHLQAESSLSGGPLQYEYVWFGGTPVGQIDIGGSAHWTVTDQRGAPFMQTNNVGQLYWQADYEPFGAVYDERTADVHQPLRLPGQEAEEFSTSEGPNGASGRYYNGFRWYRPLYGRYTQPDPVGYAGSAYNLYAYSSNNPYSYLDPLGLSCSPGIGPTSWFTPLLIGLSVAALLIPGIDVPFLLATGAELLADEAGTAEIGLALEGTGTAVEALGEASLAEASATSEALLPSEGVELADVPAEGDLAFSQTTASPYFRLSSPFEGQSIQSVAQQLRAGSLAVTEVPVTTINMAGTQLIVDTRSALALMQAGIPQSEWALADATGNIELEGIIAQRLADNGLTAAGVDTIRITGLGENASTLFPNMLYFPQYPLP